jgi:regulator of protease activity HflC (stomatin/prohibitin superfamily)
MELKIDIGPSSAYSESLMMSSLDKLHDSQEIDTIQYLKYVPNSVAPYKDRLIKELQAQQEQQAQMQQQQAQQQAQDQQGQMMMQQQQADAQAQQNAPHPFDQVLAQMPKHEQDQFRKMSPEQQNAIMQQFEQGGSQ